METAAAHAAAAPEDSVQAAEAAFPQLAAAGRSRQLNGGRFILALKKLVSLGATDLLGKGTNGSAIRTLLGDALGATIGATLTTANPLLGALTPEIQKLINEVIGGGGDVKPVIASPPTGDADYIVKVYKVKGSTGETTPIATPPVAPAPADPIDPTGPGLISLSPSKGVAPSAQGKALGFGNPPSTAALQAQIEELKAKIQQLEAPKFSTELPTSLPVSPPPPTNP